MESRPQNPEFRNNPEHFHPCSPQELCQAYHNEVIMNSLHGVKKRVTYFLIKY